MGFNYYEKRKELNAEILANIGDCPEREVVYYGYKDGKAAAYASRIEAESYGSKFIESVLENKAEIDDYWKQYHSLVSVLDKQFHDYLREEYSNLNDETYAICYSQAYEDGHSSGYDEVENYMSTYVDMAERIIKANK
jgi:hypothetical protein